MSDARIGSTHDRTGTPATSADATRDGQAPDEGPSDRTTLTAVLDAYRASGFTGDFSPEEGTVGERGGSSPTAWLRCGSCASLVDPHTVEMHSIRRLEGASDPADMVAVVAATCPACGENGVVVVGFGPMASAVDSDVFLAMRDRRGDDVLPPAHAPAEAARSEGEASPTP